MITQTTTAPSQKKHASTTTKQPRMLAPNQPVYVVDSAPYTHPENGEIVIKTRAVAINPADVVIQKLGILVQEYPVILGCDVAGEVVEVGGRAAADDDDDEYEVGDRVIGSASALERKDGTYCYSGFQEYVVLKAPFIAKIPNDVAYEDAVVLPLGINTAASCLFSDKTLGLEVSSLDGTKLDRRGKTVLIWGASGSVGSCGVQLASQAGYEVVGVASKKNHEMVRGLGASACFDYNKSTLVDDVVECLKTESKDVVGAYHAIADPSAITSLCSILAKTGGGSSGGGKKLPVVASVLPGAEANATNGITVVTNFATNAAHSEFGKATWQWLTRAMERKSVKYMPQPEGVGKGLEQVQQAVDLLAKGVSAKKLVVSI